MTVRPSPRTSSVIVPGERAPRWWRSPLAFVGGALAAYGALCAAFFRASGRGPDAFVVTPRTIEAAEAPPWLSSAEVARINALGDAVRGRSSADPNLARDLAACYEESPWVARVLHVRRAHPSSLEVALAIRRPFAVVKAASGLPIVLDRTGCRLPASADPAGLPGLSGTIGRPPPPGEMWQSVRVTDGLRVLARYNGFVARTPSLAAHAAVEVRVDRWAGPEGRPVVELVTRKGLRVIWGVDLPNASASLAGPSAEEKLASLANVLPRLGSAPPAGGERRAVAYVNVRHSSGVSLGFAGSARGVR